MGEKKAFVKCVDVDDNEGNLSYWKRKVEEYRAMLIPPYYPYREALDKVAELTGPPIH